MSVRQGGAVRVVVPVKLARLRVWVDKGRHWSGADRLVLWALSVQPRTATDLAAEACLPARLINEIVLRMMRFGWVELAATPKGAAFRATRVGREAFQHFEVLPPVTKRTARRVSFVLEPTEWRAFGLRDLKPYRPREVDSIAREHDVRRMFVDGGWEQMSTQDIYSAAEQVLPDDEELSTVDFNASNADDQFALFTVLNGVVKGMPPDPPNDLVELVKHAASERSPGEPVRIKSSRRASKALESPTDTAIALPALNPADIVLSGPDHRELLLDILRRARARFVMHSTFLREAAFLELQDEFRRAAKRGVHIDIFWGAARDERGLASNLGAAIAINHLISADHHLRGRARVHLYSTHSHAKLLLADQGGGPEGEHVAVIGSCNWLSTGYTRVEGSVVIRHPQAVSRIAQEFADLVFGSSTSSQVAGHLTTISRTLKKQSGPSGDARLQVVAGDAHGVLLREAREKAERSIVIGGDRLGFAAEARTIVPMITAAKRDVDAVICFSRPSGPVTRQDQRNLTTQAAAANVRLVQIPDRELHGKFLLWDDDHVVITSLNWSSADTRRDMPQAEIGLYLQSPGLASDLRRRLLEDWPALGPSVEAENTADPSKGKPRRSRQVALK